MNKENNRSAAGLRRSAIAERIRLREEWMELKGTSDQQPPLTASNGQRRAHNLMKKQTIKKNEAPGNSRAIIIRYPRTCVKTAQIKEVLTGVVALVEVGTESRALPLRAALTALGATVVPAWTPIVTHVVWAQGGCRSTRAKARALASRLVSPLWVEACAAAQRRLPEQTFPAAARASDLPSPRTLRQLLKKAEMENIPLIDLLHDNSKEDGKAPRLRLSSDTENDTSADKSTDTSHDKSTDKSADTSHDTSHETSRDTSYNKTETRVNTAPRRALPISMSPPRAAKSRRKLFTHKEADDTKNKSADESDEDPKRNRVVVPKPTPRARRELARAERMARRLVAATTPATAPATATAHASRPRIVLTGMNKSERRAVTAAIQSLNGRIQNHVTRKTTHVILGSCRSDNEACSQITDDTSLKRNPLNKGVNITGISNLNTVTPLIVHRSDITKARTLNALLGAARGARVLKAQWVMDSKEKGHWVHPYGYEVPHLKKISEKARIERNALGRANSEYAYDVFNGMCVRVSPNAEQRDAATQLLKLCGAIVQDGDCQQNGGHDLTIGIGDGEVSSKWVFDSVAAARMRTTRRYVNNPLSNTIITQTTDR